MGLSYDLVLFHGGRFFLGGFRLLLGTFTAAAQNTFATFWPQQFLRFFEIFDLFSIPLLVLFGQIVVKHLILVLKVAPLLLYQLGFLSTSQAFDRIISIHFCLHLPEEVFVCRLCFLWCWASGSRGARFNSHFGTFGCCQTFVLRLSWWFGFRWRLRLAFESLHNNRLRCKFLWFSLLGGGQCFRRWWDHSYRSQLLNLCCSSSSLRLFLNLLGLAFNEHYRPLDLW